MKRLWAVLLLFAFAGCAEMEEVLIPEGYGDPCCGTSMPSVPYQPTAPPPLAQPSSVVPAGYSPSTTQEPELLNPGK
jgi:hypothetical protein